MKLSQRNFGLDILRAISIWLVLLQHGKILNIDGLKGLTLGGIGVEIFFVLSGFLIGQIIIRNLQKSNTIKCIVNFWIRRWFRILPLYYLMLLFKFTIIDSSIGSNILYYIFFLQNNFYGIEYYEVTWSLVIEEWFYIIIPIFLFLTLKLSRKKNNVVIILFILFILFENIIRLIYVKKFNVPYSGVNGNVIFRMDALFYGVLLAYIKINFQNIFIKLSSLPIFIFSLICFITYIYFIITFSKLELGINGYIIPRTIGFTIFPLIIAFILPFFDSKSSFFQNSIPRKIYYKFITYTSLLTYSIYLVHPLIFEQLINKKLFKMVPEISFILATTLTYMISYILFKFFEAPILKYRNKKFSDRVT